LLNHVPSQAGTYVFQFEIVDELTAVWIGEHAQSGITVDQASLTAALSTYNPPKQYAYVLSTEDVGKPVPFRVFWSNVDGPTVHTWSHIDPTGAPILVSNAQKNKLIVTSCSGPGVDLPAFPAWETVSYALQLRKALDMIF